jgi:alpha-tubulin suppressor-like RCC1 family protein
MAKIMKKPIEKNVVLAKIPEPKFVQITAGHEALFALDENGDAWVYKYGGGSYGSQPTGWYKMHSARITE